MPKTPTWSTTFYWSFLAVASAFGIVHYASLILFFVFAGGISSHNPSAAVEALFPPTPAGATVGGLLVPRSVQELGRQQEDAFPERRGLRPPQGTFDGACATPPAHNVPVSDVIEDVHLGQKTVTASTRVPSKNSNSFLPRAALGDPSDATGQATPAGGIHPVPTFLGASSQQPAASRAVTTPAGGGGTTPGSIPSFDTAAGNYTAPGACSTAAAATRVANPATQASP
ncbi:unnamed protein product, partial [Amoebophrya sp. A120]|eukprot:GSA120T00019327001.1